MNDDDKELFGIVKDTTAHIKLILVKVMPTWDCVKWAKYAMSEIHNHKLFANEAAVQFTEIYAIEGCKDYFLVLASSKKHKTNHSYIKEIREILKEMQDAYLKNMCSQKAGDKLIKIRHRDFDLTVIERLRDKIFPVLKLLYPSFINLRREQNKPQKPAVTQKEASRLMNLYVKNKDPVDGQPVAPSKVSVPDEPKKWSDTTMATVSKLKFLLKAKLTPTSHPNSKLAGYVIFTNEKTSSSRIYEARGVAPAPTRKLKTTWTMEAQQDIHGGELNGKTLSVGLDYSK